MGQLVDGKCKLRSGSVCGERPVKRVDRDVVF